MHTFAVTSFLDEDTVWSQQILVPYIYFAQLKVTISCFLDIRGAQAAKNSKDNLYIIYGQY